ncbi:NBS-LRR disease resistance protein, partial [Trifolium pratense]
RHCISRHVGCTKLETFPRGLGKMTSLRYLLITTKQSVLALSEFANLNNLQGFRWIEGAAETLETLTIELPDLHTLSETMSRLKRLAIFASPKQLILSSGIQHLNTLEDLFILGCPEF